MFKNNVFNPGISTGNWIKAAAIRAVKTTAQTAVSMISIEATLSQVDWGKTVGTAVCAGVLSILTSIAGLPEVKQQ